MKEGPLPRAFPQGLGIVCDRQQAAFEGEAALLDLIEQTEEIFEHAEAGFSIEHAYIGSRGGLVSLMA